MAENEMISKTLKSVPLGDGGYTALLSHLENKFKLESVIQKLSPVHQPRKQIEIFLLN